MNSFVTLVFLLLFSAANILTSYLYLYPFFKGCRFGEKPTQLKDGKLIPGHAAPFRMLVLGDPQLEGSSSLLNPDYKYFPSLWTLLEDARDAPTLAESFTVAQSHLQDLVHIDVPVVFQSWRKRLDLFGNDFYLAHINRCLQWFTYPTHTAVLGDLLGSQWIDDSEFEERGRRYWQRMFAGGHRVEDEITGHIETTRLGKEKEEEWAKRVINIAGNHDIGYAGDMAKSNVERFDRVFGRSNWETRFVLPILRRWEKPLPELRVVVLNSLNIDGPVVDTDLQTSTFAFIDKLSDDAKPVNETTSATILLTHLPLHKEAGVCIDGPYVKYHPEERGGGIEEQNHLSAESSATLLDKIFAMGGANTDGSRNGIILTGHDHEGCDVYQYLSEQTDDTEPQWIAEKWDQSSATRHADVPGIREITVRSMMGDFDGNAGMLSAWFDMDNLKWEFEYKTCVLGQPHFWWAVHVLDIVTIILGIYVAMGLARGTPEKEKKIQAGRKEKTL